MQAWEGVLVLGGPCPRHLRWHRTRPHAPWCVPLLALAYQHCKPTQSPYTGSPQPLTNSLLLSQLAPAPHLPSPRSSLLFSLQALTDWHFLLLAGDRLRAVNRVSGRPVGELPLRSPALSRDVSGEPPSRPVGECGCMASVGACCYSCDSWPLVKNSRVCVAPVQTALWWTPPPTQCTCSVMRACMRCVVVAQKE